MEPITRYRLKLAVVDRLSRLGVPVQRLNRQDRKRLNSQKSKKQLKRASTNPRASFGVPLETVVNRTGQQSGSVVVPKCLAQIATIVRQDISTEGIFRVCGSSARMKASQVAVDNGGDVEGTVHDAAGLLKQFLRDLPEPLLTYRLYEPFIRAYNLPGPRQRAEALQLLCLELPEAHRDTLGFLMRLLRDVVRSETSRMTVFNLAAIFTPNILKPIVNVDSHVITDKELENHATCVSIVEFLIDNCELIGTVPPHVQRQASEHPSEEKARKEYLSCVSGQKAPWWSMLFVAKLKVRSQVREYSRPMSVAIPEPSPPPEQVQVEFRSSAWDYVGDELTLSRVASTALPDHEEDPTLEAQDPAVAGFDNFMMY